MNKKKVTRIALAFAMLLGISIAWAAEAEQHSNSYGVCKTFFGAANDALSAAQNNVAQLHLNLTGTTYKAGDPSEDVWTGLNKYLDRRAEILKLIQDSVEAREAAWQAADSTTRVKMDNRAWVREILDKGDTIWLDGKQVTRDEFETLINEDLAAKFTTGNIDLLYGAWYYIDGHSKSKDYNKTTETYTYTKANAGFAALEDALDELEKAMEAVEGEKWYAADKATYDATMTAQTKNIERLDSAATQALNYACLACLRSLGQDTTATCGTGCKGTCFCEKAAEGATAIVNGPAIAAALKAATDSLNAKAQDQLEAKLAETWDLYNSTYRALASKYEQTGKLEEKQKDFSEQFYIDIADVEKKIDTATAGDYSDIIKALDGIQSDINTWAVKNIGELEAAIIEANNNLYNLWVAGLDADSVALEGSYGDTRSKYIDAAKKMAAYKGIAEQADAESKADAEDKLKAAEAALYAQYDSLEANKEAVKAAKDSANVDPEEYTTTYLANVIDDYTAKGLDINAAIEECIADAMNAVRKICVELVKTKALVPCAVKVYEAYHVFDADEYADVKDQAQKEIEDSIEISLTVECNSPKVGQANPISNIAYTHVKAVGRYYNGEGYKCQSKETGLYYIVGGEGQSFKMEFDDGDEKSDRNVINGDNYQKIIIEINTNVTDSVDKCVLKWKDRQSAITAEKEAKENIETLIKEVRSYWTRMYAANEGNKAVQDSLETLRDGIDALEEQYNDSVAADDNSKTEVWEKHAILDVKEDLAEGLTEYYQKIYTLTDGAAKDAAEDAVKDLMATIDSAYATVAVTEEKAEELAEAIYDAENAVEAANAAIEKADGTVGDTKNDAYGNAQTVAETAKKELEEAIADATKLEKGDANGDGKVSDLDYVALVDLILDENWTDEQLAMCDFDEDGTLTVGDLGKLLSILYPDSDESDVEAIIANNSVSAANDLQLTSQQNGSMKRIALSLSSSNIYAACQLDVILPEGVTIVNEQLADATTDHNIYSKDNANGTHRIVIGSLTNSTLNANGEVVIYIDVMGEQADRVVVDNVIAADAAGQSYLVTSKGQTTGISGVSAEMGNGEKVYSVGGQMLNGMKRGINIVRNADGTTQKVVRK